MRKKSKPEKTPEQIERERERAREAVRRHRAHREAQKEAMRPQYYAMRRVNAALSEMIFGKKSHSRYSRGRVRTHTETRWLASALFDALGGEVAAKLAATLAHELEIGGTTAQRDREFREKYGDRTREDVLRMLMGAS